MEFLKRSSTGPAQPTRLIMDTSDATEGLLYALPRALSAMERPPEAEPVSAANTLVATRHERSALNLRFTRNDHRQGLEVRLELDVVTHLAVDLKAVALTVGDNDPISLRIEVHRRRETEAPERLEIARSPVRLHHVGIGVDALLSPLRHHLGVAHQMGQRGAFRVENAKAVIAPVGDVDVAVGIDRHVGRVIKNPRLGVSRRVGMRDERTEIGHGEGILWYRKRPVFADRHDELAVWRELLHAVVLPIRDIDIALVVEGDAPRLVELPLAAAAPAALGQGLAVGGEDLQAVVAAVNDNHIAAGVADDPGRILQFSRTATRRSPLANELARGIEDRDGVRPLVRHVHGVVLVHRDPERPDGMSICFAVRAELG